MPLRLCLLAALCLTLAPSCGGDDDGDGSSPSIDADPGASDADPDQADGGGGGGTAGEVPCGNEPTCTAPEGCCVTGGGVEDKMCTAQGDCPEGIFQGCDGRNDCGDDYCCAGEGGIVCAAAGDCTLAICFTPDDCPNEGDMCCGAEGEQSGACAPDCGG